MNDSPTAVRLASQDESIAPVTIFDGQGSVVQVMSAADFRRRHPLALDRGDARRARRRERQRAESPSQVGSVESP